MKTRRNPLLFVLVLACFVTSAIPGVRAAARADDAVVAPHKMLTLAGAQRVLAAAIAAARGLNAHGGIAVVDADGTVISLALIDGTFPQASMVAIGKAHTAAVFRKDSNDFEKAINGGRIALGSMKDFTPLQGAVVIRLGGEIVGAIGVSGTASQQQDEDVAKAGAAAISGP
jgi:glc operon protein GlcG